MLVLCACVPSNIQTPNIIIDIRSRTLWWTKLLWFKWKTKNQIEKTQMAKCVWKYYFLCSVFCYSPFQNTQLCTVRSTAHWNFPLKTRTLVLNFFGKTNNKKKTIKKYSFRQFDKKTKNRAIISIFCWLNLNEMCVLHKYQFL